MVSLYSVRNAFRHVLTVDLGKYTVRTAAQRRRRQRQERRPAPEEEVGATSANTSRKEEEKGPGFCLETSSRISYDALPSQVVEDGAYQGLPAP